MSMHGRCSAMRAMQALRAMRQGQAMRALRVSGRCGQFVGARLVIHCPATGAMMSMDGRCPAMRYNGEQGRGDASDAHRYGATGA